MELVLDILAQIATWGLLAVLVMAINAVVLTWLGGWWGLLAGQLYLALFVLNLDLNVVPGPLDAQFVLIWLIHVVAINVLIFPAWLLGMLLRDMRRQRKARATTATETASESSLS